MPLYEYYCAECRNTFDTLRPAAKADDTILCKHCESRQTSRTLSVFAAHSKGSQSSAPAPAYAGNMGGGCCGGACGCSH